MRRPYILIGIIFVLALAGFLGWELVFSPSGEIRPPEITDDLTVERSDRGDNLGGTALIEGEVEKLLFKFVVRNNSSTREFVLSQFDFSQTPDPGLGSVMFPATLVTNMRLFNDGDILAGPVILSSGTMVLETGVLIPTESEREFEVRADIGVNASPIETMTNLRLQLDAIDAHDVQSGDVQPVINIDADAAVPPFQLNPGNPVLSSEFRVDP